MFFLVSVFPPDSWLPTQILLFYQGRVQTTSTGDANIVCIVLLVKNLLYILYVLYIYSVCVSVYSTRALVQYFALLTNYFVGL